MDLATVIGLAIGFGMVVWAMFLGGSLRQFFDFPSVLIVLGGTGAAILANFPLDRVRNVVAVVRKTVFHQAVDLEGIIAKMVGHAERARREGMLALERAAETEEDPFLRKGLRLAVDGTDPQLLEKILQTDIEQLEARHKEGRRLLEAGGAYAPAFGMIGTLIGLIRMLANMENPASIGPGMSVALVTTFYGVLLANVLFLPLAGKLAARSEEEILRREMVVEGVLSIQSGDSPRIVAEKLRSFLAPAAQRRLELVRENRLNRAA